MAARKTVLITGCSAGGIGDALAQQFHHAGLRVFASARNLTKIAHLKELGCDVVALDVVDANSIAAAVKHIGAETNGSLDYLVNNSGGGYTMPCLDVNIEDAKAIYDVNVWALFSVTQAFMPLLVKAKGTVANNTSIVSVLPSPWSAVYNSSKAAAASITTSLRTEVAPLGVKVVEIKTGAVRSKFFDNQVASFGIDLPANSYYLPAKDILNQVLGGKAIEENQKMDVDVYAKKVVHDLTSSSFQRVIWRGGSATVAWIVDTFLAHSIRDYVLAKYNKTDQVKQAISGKTKA